VPTSYSRPTEASKDPENGRKDIRAVDNDPLPQYSHRFRQYVWLEDQLVEALLDTGADSDIVTKEWADAHPQLRRKPSRKRVYPAFGKPLINPDTVDVLIRTKRQGAPQTITCIIAPLHEQTLLLSDDTRLALGIPMPPELEREMRETSEPCPLPRKIKKDHPADGPGHYLSATKIPEEREPSAQRLKHDETNVPKTLVKILARFQDLFGERLVQAGRADTAPTQIYVPAGHQIYVPPRQIPHQFLDDHGKN